MEKGYSYMAGEYSPKTKLEKKLLDFWAKTFATSSGIFKHNSVCCEFIEKGDNNKMTNEEKYEYYMSTVGHFGLALVKGRVAQCISTECEECDFYRESKDCIEVYEEWLKQECKPQINNDTPQKRSSNHKRIAQFKKVSLEQYHKDRFIYDNETYNDIKLPKRATKGSAGYDFFAPFDIELKPNESIKFATGIRVEMQPEWVLKLYPRSGLGFKYRLQLDNTVGVIDSDYYYSDNEGHIHAKLTNDSREGKTVIIKKGTAFMQGIFIEYGVTIDDEVEETRNGGFGSTTQGGV